MPTPIRRSAETPEWAPREGEYCRAAYRSQVSRLGAEGAVDNPAEAVRSTWTINTAQEDRHNTVIPAANLDLANYRANPVVFFNHRSWSHPIGNSAVRLVGTGDDARLEATMADGDRDDGGDWDLEYEEAAHTYRQVKKGLLHGASIGFRGRWERELIDPEGDPYDWKNIRYRLAEGELVEWSPVGVPSNPGALVTARMLSRAGIEAPSAPVAVPVGVDLAPRGETAPGELLETAPQQDLPEALRGIADKLDAMTERLAALEGTASGTADAVEAAADAALRANEADAASEPDASAREAKPAAEPMPAREAATPADEAAPASRREPTLDDVVAEALRLYPTVKLAHATALGRA